MLRRRAERTATADDGNDRVFFTLLDQLRAVAALLVVFSHLVTNFLLYYGRTWGPNELIEQFTVTPLDSAIEFGSASCALFIRGFVITRAAARESAAEFALAATLAGRPRARWVSRQRTDRFPRCRDSRAARNGGSDGNQLPLRREAEPSTRRLAGAAPQTKAPTPVMARPTIKVFISRVPS